MEEHKSVDSLGFSKISEADEEYNITASKSIKVKQQINSGNSSLNKDFSKSKSIPTNNVNIFGIPGKTINSSNLKSFVSNLRSDLD